MYPMEEVDPYMPQEPPAWLLKKTLARRKPEVSVTESAGGTLTDNVQPKLPSAIERYRKMATDLYGQGSDMLDQEPDMAPMQAYAKQRSQQGNAAMLNAMAAQYAGESFEPMQAQFLKRAAAARDPLKMGSGYITPEGQYLKDPEVAQTKKAEFLMNQAKAYETLAQSAQTAQERAEAQRLQAEASNELRRMMMESNNQFKQQGLELQRQGLEIRRQNAGKGDDSKQWRAEDNLRGDFDKLTKDLREEMNATSKITQIVKATPPGQKPDAITQQSLVILLNKFLDPGSVVREGEFDRVVKAQGLEGQARNLADRILKGQPLDANTIKQIDGLAQLYSKAAESKVMRHAANYTDIARRRGLDADAVISEPRFRSGGGRNVQVDY